MTSACLGALGRAVSQRGRGVGGEPGDRAVSLSDAGAKEAFLREACVPAGGTFHKVGLFALGSGRGRPGKGIAGAGGGQVLSTETPCQGLKQVAREGKWWGGLSCIVQNHNGSTQGTGAWARASWKFSIRPSSEHIPKIVGVQGYTTPL